MSDSSCSLCTGLMAAVVPIFHRTQKGPKKSDVAVTVPFDLKRQSWLLAVKTLRRTKARWCWFEQASEDDEKAGTRLGTLRFLPPEIRRQIFKMVLEDCFHERIRKERLFEAMYSGISSEHCDHLIKWHLRYEGKFCRCWRDRNPEPWDIFNLESYNAIEKSAERVPLSLRSVSPSIRQELDRVFLTSNTFEFSCPSSLERFLDRLSPSQQAQLKCVRLHVFGFYSLLRSTSTRYGDWCTPDASHFHELWIAICERLPSRLKSVQINVSYRSRRWREESQNHCWANNARDVDRVVEVLRLLSKQVCRACSQANISLTGWEELSGANQGTREVLEAVLQELEPWSKEWHEWKENTFDLG